MRIILDTDMAMGAPGSEIDDGFALALLLSEPKLELELLTSVNGNIDVESATYLSCELLQRLGRPDIPVVRGAAAPLIEPESARGAPQEVRSRYGHHQATPGYAAEEIARRVMADPGEITLVAIGPLTNIAAAINLEPRVAECAKEIMVMGGVYSGHTNRIGMPGEFNFWVDPHAARAVVRSGARLSLVGLDVTLQVRLTREHAHQMAQSGGAFGAFAGECTVAWLDRLHREHPHEPGSGDSCAMHDALAIAALSQPHLLTWRPALVDVATQTEGRGVAIAEYLPDDPHLHSSKIRVATDVEADAFTAHFLSRINTL